MLDGRGKIHCPKGNTLRGVWGSSGNDVFAVGSFGTILHYNGSSWSSMASGTTQHLGSDEFAVGYGNILHYNGSSWSSMTSGTTQFLNGVWSSSGSDVLVVGSSGTILHYDGTVLPITTSSTTTTIPPTL